jgi:hypothetical protein
VLNVVVSGELGALAGCTTVLGSPKTDATVESAPARRTDASVEPSREGSPATSEASSLGSLPVPEDEARDTAQDQIIEGPVESPATNERPYADPADGLVLTNVTLAVSEPFRRGSFRQMDDTISTDIEGEHFTATGRGHVEWECDGVQFKTVVVDGRDARVYLGTTAVDSCRSSENKVGRGPWSVSFTITGQFVGGRPDSLQMSIQGPFVENAGVFVAEEL